MQKKDKNISNPLSHLQTKKHKINVFQRLTSFAKNASKQPKKQQHLSKTKNQSKHKIKSKEFEQIKPKISIYKSNEKQETKLRKKNKIIDNQLQKIHSQQTLNSGIHIKMKSEDNLEKGKMTNLFQNIHSVQGWAGSKKNLPVSSEQIQVYMKSFENNTAQKLQAQRSFLSSNRETSLVLINENPQSHKSIQKLKKPIKKPNQLKLKLNQKQKIQQNPFPKNAQEINHTQNILKIVKQIDVVISSTNINPIQQENKLNQQIDMYKNKCKGLQTQLQSTLQKVKEMQNQFIHSHKATSSNSTTNPSSQPTQQLTNTNKKQQQIQLHPISYQSQQSSKQTTKIHYSNLTNPNQNKNIFKTITYSMVSSTNNTYSNPQNSNIQTSPSLFTTTPPVMELPVSTPSQQIKQFNAFTSGPSRIVIGPGSPKIIRFGINRNNCTKGCSSYCTCLINST